MDAENVKHFFEKSFVCGRQGEFSLLDDQGRFKMDAVLIGFGFRFHTLPLLDVRSCCGFTWHDYTGTARAEQRTNRPGLGKYGQKPCICGGKQKKPQRHLTSAASLVWSEWRDSNSRPPAPKAGALPTAQHPVRILDTLLLYLFLAGPSRCSGQKTAAPAGCGGGLSIFGLKQSVKWCIIKCIERKRNSGQRCPDQGGNHYGR